MPGGAGGWALSAAALAEVVAVLQPLNPRVEQHSGAFGIHGDVGADSAQGAHATLPIQVDVDELLG